jgi:hypothetical protein
MLHPAQPPRSDNAQNGRSRRVLLPWIVPLLATLLTACAGPMRWERPDTDQATADADREECRVTSRAQYLRLTRQPLFVPYFVTVRDDKGRVRSIPVVPFEQFGPPIWAPYAPHLAINRTTMRRDLFESCLEAKGYRLVPEEDASAAGSPAPDAAATVAPSGLDASGDAAAPAE